MGKVEEIENEIGKLLLLRQMAKRDIDSRQAAKECGVNPNIFLGVLNGAGKCKTWNMNWINSIYYAGAVGSSLHYMQTGKQDRQMYQRPIDPFFVSIFDTVEEMEKERVPRAKYRPRIKKQKQIEKS